MQVLRHWYPPSAGHSPDFGLLSGQDRAMERLGQWQIARLAVEAASRPRQGAETRWLPASGEIGIVVARPPAI
jgi:hypothetical protein